MTRRTTTRERANELAQARLLKARSLETIGSILRQLEFDGYPIAAQTAFVAARAGWGIGWDAQIAEAATRPPDATRTDARAGGPCSAPEDRARPDRG